MCPRNHELRPMRDLLQQLPRLPLNAGNDIDFQRADQALLEKLADDAETTVSALHHGITAFGHLIAHSAVPIEDGSIGAPTVEACGWLLAELGDLASAATFLATGCRSALAQLPRLARAKQRRL